MGSMLEFKTAEGANLLRPYITDNTLVHGQLREIPRRFAGIDLALLYLGGTRVLGVLLTIDGKQGVQALKIVRPARPYQSIIMTTPSSNRPCETSSGRSGRLDWSRR
jgi:hypothetical protein